MKIIDNNIYSTPNPTSQNPTVCLSSRKSEQLGNIADTEFRCTSFINHKRCLEQFEVSSEVLLQSSEGVVSNP